MDHRIMEISRVVSSLKGVSHEQWPHCSGLYQVDGKVLKDGDSIILSAQPVPLRDCLHGEKVSLNILSESFFSTYIHCLLSSNHASLCRDWLHFGQLWYLVRVAVSSPWGHLFLRLNKLPQPFLVGPLLLHLTILMALCWTQCNLYISLLYWGPANWMQCLDLV